VSRAFARHNKSSDCAVTALLGNERRVVENDLGSNNAEEHQQPQQHGGENNVKSC
jgi:hypothetical protein